MLLNRPLNGWLRSGCLCGDLAFFASVGKNETVQQATILDGKDQQHNGDQDLRGEVGPSPKQEHKADKVAKHKFSLRAYPAGEARLG